MRTTLIAERAPRLGRGFTLIEILLAIGLLVAVLSIAGPVLYSRLAPRTFDETLERFAGELRLAREDARRTGEITLVYVTRGARGVRLETRRTPLEDQGAPAPFGGDGSDGNPSFGSDVPPFGGGSDAGPGAIGGGIIDDERPRLLFVLPEGFELVHTRPSFLIEDDGFGVAMDDAALAEIGGIEAAGDDPFEEGVFGEPGGFGIGGLDAEPESVLLAVCVPDGTVLAARPTWLIDEDERAARLRIDPASGLIALERIQRTPGTVFGAEMADEFGITPDGASGPASGRGRAGPARGERRP